jgi:type I restriction enzyme, S subunit
MISTANAAASGMSKVWPNRILRELADIRVSNVDKKTIASEKFVKLCNYMDVYSNQYVTSRLPFMEASATAAELARFGLNKGDVIITKDSETPDDIGIAAVVAEQIDDLVCGYHLALIRPDAEQVDSIYLAKQLSTERVARFFALQASGSTRYGLPISTIESVEIPTPPKPEQSKIAEILSTVDRAIEQTEALITKQKRIKTGLMQDLLTRGIDEHGNLRSEQTHKFKDSPLGRIPVEWNVKQLSSVVELKVGYAFKSSWFCEDGIPLLRGENVGTEIPDWKDMRCLPPATASKFEEYRLDVGDMIIGMDRTFTKQGFKLSLLSEEDVPCLLVQRVGCFVPRNIPRGFMQLLIQSPPYRRQLLLQQKGMDIPHLSKSEILSPLVPIPSALDEMNVISNRIESSRSMERNNIYRLNKFRSLKTALMQDLLTGKKRVTPILEKAEKL